MKKTKGLAALLLALVMACSLFACGEKGTSADPAVPAAKTDMRVLTLKGPTGIGMVKLMADQDAATAANNYAFTVAAAPTDAVAAISSGSADIAAVPVNVAATLYQKTNGNVQLLAVNTLGVLSILDNSDSVASIADLKGKTVYATGQGSTPEYVLNYILRANGLEPGKDVTVEFKGEHAELATLAAADQVSVCMLPEPNVTAVLTQNSKVKIALNLTEEWEKACEKSGTPSRLVMGCVIARKEFAEQNHAAVNAFLEEYQKSVAYVNDAETMEQAARLVEQYAILPKAAVALKAIPNCNITFLSGDQMKTDVRQNLNVLFQANPASIGGVLPDDNFYYSR